MADKVSNSVNTRWFICDLATVFPPHATRTYLIPSVTVLGLHNRLVVGTWMQMLDGVRHDMCERLRCRAMLGREYKIVPSAGLLECVVHLRQRVRQKERERGKLVGVREQDEMWALMAGNYFFLLLTARLYSSLSLSPSENKLVTFR